MHVMFVKFLRSPFEAENFTELNIQFNHILLS